LALPADLTAAEKHNWATGRITSVNPTYRMEDGYKQLRLDSITFPEFWLEVEWRDGAVDPVVRGRMSPQGPSRFYARIFNETRNLLRIDDAFHPSVWLEFEMQWPDA